MSSAQHPGRAALTELPYEAWIVRRTAANSLHVLHAAVAAGPGEVVIPLPWPEARLLDETPGHDGPASGPLQAPNRAPFSRLWPVAVSMWKERHRIRNEIPYPPPSVEDDEGERGVRLVSRDGLPEALAESLPPSWSFAQKFLLWPAAPERRGITAWLPRSKLRPLAPVALAIEGASSPFRERLANFEMAVATTADLADYYLIDAEQLEALPRRSYELYRRTRLAIPGLLEPNDHLHWARTINNSRQAYIFRFQLYADALREDMP